MTSAHSFTTAPLRFPKPLADHFYVSILVEEEKGKRGKKIRKRERGKTKNTWKKKSPSLELEWAVYLGSSLAHAAKHLACFELRRVHACSNLRHLLPTAEVVDIEYVCQLVSTMSKAIVP